MRECRGLEGAGQLHFAVDAAGALLSGFGVNVVLIEIVVGIFTVLTALLARKVWRDTM